MKTKRRTVYKRHHIPEPTEGYLTVDQIADLSRCEVETVRGWIRSGKLRAIVDRSGHPRYIVKKEDYQTFTGSID